MNHYYETLFRYIEQIIIMPERDKNECRQSFSPIRVTKDTLLERAGSVPNHHNFIVSGYMRNFYNDEKGEEITVDLNDGPRFFTSYFHFMNQTVSNENLQCITDCELLRITFDDAQATVKTSITQKDFTIKLFQKIQEDDKQRMNDLAALSAEQRYLKLVSEKPNIIKNVPLKYISSYLGIKPESLSRIRRELFPNIC
ncbi:Crp/Fnr family transcriptional regulator [Pedobacter nototheniae]|uniref:Crp/Fnr family transcriptional regulator n=1 Tax=Pedobacter nototheniae TaxID=2488994 RepID=UPI00292F608F|nr:Crp/Fnr family transcriptional regulator [Pedobacter nototheniae]